MPFRNLTQHKAMTKAAQATAVHVDHYEFKDDEILAVYYLDDNTDDVFERKTDDFNFLLSAEALGFIDRFDFDNNVVYLLDYDDYRRPDDPVERVMSISDFYDSIYYDDKVKILEHEIKQIAQTMTSTI
jgi:hypothetical protein